MHAGTLLLCVAVLASGCASLTPAPGRGTYLDHAPRDATSLAPAEGECDEQPHALASPSLSRTGAEVPEHLHRRRNSREVSMGGARAVMLGP